MRDQYTTAQENQRWRTPTMLHGRRTGGNVVRGLSRARGVPSAGRLRHLCAFVCSVIAGWPTPYAVYEDVAFACAGGVRSMGEADGVSANRVQTAWERTSGTV